MNNQTTIRTVLAAMAMTALTATPTMAQTRTVKLKVVETSDVHGHFFPYDFINQQPLRGTLARVNTYMKEVRREMGDNVLLIDNGDILQGQPTCYWSNYVNTGQENIAAQVVNYMDYDAETVGNHDVEPGHAVYDKWIREVRCPVLGANIVETRSGKPYVKPYSVHYKDGVKVCILGMLTPAIPNWLNESVWSGMEFREMVSCARHWVDVIRSTEQPDVLLGLFHSGWNGGIVTPEYEEDGTESVAREVPGFDVIFFGHDHREHNLRVTNTEGAQVLCLDPSCYARKVAEADITLTYDARGRLVRKDVEGRLVDVSDLAVDQPMVQHFQPDIERIRQYCERQIGTFDRTISTRDCFFGNSAFCDLIHNLQLKLTGADISFNAPLAFNAEIKEGPIHVSDMFNLYKFENLLFVLNMTGDEVRRHLELSYDQWTQQMHSPDDHIMLLNENNQGDMQRYGFRNFTFNFDSAAGIDYEVDVTKPEGERVRILRMSDGRPFSPDKWYRVAMNSYRGNGGGELLTRGAGIPKDSINGRIVYQSQLDTRHYLMEEIEKLGTVSPQPNHNWRFVPEEWAAPAIERDRKYIFGQ